VERKKNNDASDEDENDDSDEDEDLSSEGDDDVSCGINNGFFIKGQLPHADDLCTDLGFE
jgi:hypothetical protein